MSPMLQQKKDEQTGFNRIVLVLVVTAHGRSTSHVAPRTRTTTTTSAARPLVAGDRGDGRSLIPRAGALT